MGENPLRFGKTTPHIAGHSIRQLKEVLPECVAEGGVDFDRLRAAHRLAADRKRDILMR